MKKLVTSFGLLALMLIVTSFTTPSEIGGVKVPGTPEPALPVRFSQDIGGVKVPGAPEPALPARFSQDIGGVKVPGAPEPAGL